MNVPLDRIGAGARDAFLERECAGASGMREQVERLLASHADAERFFAETNLLLSHPVPTASGTTD